MAIFTDSHKRESGDCENQSNQVLLSRRRFLGAATTGALAAAGALSSLPLAGCNGGGGAVAGNNPQSQSAGEVRAQTSYSHRVAAAQAELNLLLPNHQDNGDEALYPDRIGNYSKGMPHNQLGEVDTNAYASYLAILAGGSSAAFENLPLGGNVKFVDPQSGLCYDMEGTDSHQLYIPPAPTLASAWRAGEAVEDYWEALLRDVPFTQYDNHPLVETALTDINRLSDFRGPRDGNGQVTAQTLFRWSAPGDVLGPYVSQFLLMPQMMGTALIPAQFETFLPPGQGGADFMTQPDSWLAAQNGQGPFPAIPVDPVLRHLRNGRDLSLFVRMDVVFQAYFQACLSLINLGAPLNPGNPYLKSQTQAGFGTFGPPHIQGLLGEVALRALKAVWYQKWYVHRALRPEEYGGLVHYTLTGARSYPLQSDILNSQAAAQTHTTYGTYFLPMAFPEGCPQHPSYGSGHATVAGACVTVLKWFFDESWVLPNPVVPTDDGLSLVPYPGADAGELTVGGELNKAARNVGVGRNIAGVHWRSDFEQAAMLGEAVTISVLQDQKGCYNQTLPGCTFTKFDGTRITI